MSESIIPKIYSEALYGQLVASSRFFSMMNPPPLTVEELEERRARKAMREAEEAAFIAALDAVGEPLARRVLDLHAREGTHHLGCTGCDPGPYAEDSAGWPCSTVTLVAQESGVEIPAHWQ